MTISPPPVTSEDPESQKIPPRTCRCLDYFLVISVVLLTLVVGSICVYYMAWERPNQEWHQEKFISERIHRDRLRNSAQFTVDSVQMVNTNIEWQTNSLESTYKGQDISYNKTTQELEVKNEGYYYIYSQMTLKCVEKNRCSERGDVSILVHDADTEILKLDIPNGTISSFYAKIQFLPGNTKLKAQLKSDKENISWQLDQSSFIGLLFLSER